MSDNITIPDCLVHFDSRHLQVRQDFMDLCIYERGNYNNKTNTKGKVIYDEPNQECMAKILRLLETFTNERRRQWHANAIEAKQKGLSIQSEPQEFRVELTYQSFCKLMHNMYGENIVRNSIAVLLSRGFIQRYQDTNNSIPCYVLVVNAVQDALKRLAENDLSNGNRLLNLTASRKRVKKSKLAVKFNSQDTEIQDTAVKFNSQSEKIQQVAVKFNTNNIYKDTSKIEKEDNIFVTDEKNQTELDAFANASATLLEKEVVESPPEESPSTVSEEPQETNHVLPEKEQEEPPLETMVWSDEKLVRIVEMKRLYNNKVGARFSTKLVGDSKKSQRQRQLEAAKKIRAKGITEEQFIKAYTYRNDLWWNNNQGSLTVEHMAANTPSRNMRILEILEKLDSRSVRTSNAKPERPDRSSYASNIIMAPNPSPTNMRDLMAKVAAQRAATTTGGIS